MPAKRRLSRATPRQRAATARAIEKSKLAEVARDSLRVVARGVQEFAVLSMNTLAESGPAWSGEFSASWGFGPAGTTPKTPGTKGSVYVYNKNNVSVREIEKNLKNGVENWVIVNTSPHASIAIDEEESIFIPIGEPVKAPVQEGSRPDEPHLRPFLMPSDNSKRTAVITAEPFWFQNYIKGGFLQRDLSKGIALGFQAGRQ